MIHPKPFKEYLFVTVQLVLFIAYFVPLHLYMLPLSKWVGYLGLILVGLSTLLGLAALLQLNTKLSPFPSPRTTSRLLTSGAFRISRHPIYTALIFSGMGYGLYKLSFYKILIALGLLVLFYYKSVYEEKLLLQKFPEYHAYKAKTRRFI